MTNMPEQQQMPDDGITPRPVPGVVTAFIFLSASLCLALLNEGLAQEPRQAGQGGRILVTVQWGDVPLRDRLMEFGKKYSVPIFLDRRVDPDQKIELSAVDLPVEGVLALAAEKLKLGICRIGKVQYIGPKSTANALPGIVAQRKREQGKLPPQSKLLWSKARELKWDDAASPRDIAAALVEEAGAALENAEQIPHDIWPAYELPPLTLTERLSLVLAGFGQTFQVSTDGQQIRILLIPQDKSLAAGSVDQEDPPRVGVTKSVTKGPLKKTFSLTVQKQPAGAVVGTVAKQLGKEFKYDPSLRDKLREEVSFSVKDVTLEELLAKTLTPLGLSCKVTEKVLEIIPLE